MILRSPRSGYSLVELLVGAALLVVGIFAAYSLLSEFGVYFSKKQKNMMARTDAALLAGTVQKRLAGGDLKFYLFTGQTVLPRARAIIPLPSRCVDFASCAQSTSVLFANYDRAMSAAATAICAFDADRLLIDVGKTTFGQATRDGLGFKVVNTNPATEARLKLEDGEVIATVVAPTAALWQSTGEVTDAPTDTTLYTNPSCLSNATLLDPTDPSLGPDFDKLFLVRIKPLIFKQFTTSGTEEAGTLGPAVTTTALGAVFPLRLINVRMTILGMKQAVISEVGDPGHPIYEYSIFLDDCAGPSLPANCVGANQLSIQKLTHVSFQSEFRVALEPTFTSSAFVANGGTATELCTGTCRALPVGAAFTKAAMPGESFESLDASEFTLLKQEVLGKIKIEHRAQGRKPELLEVRFQ